MSGSTNFDWTVNDAMFSMGKVFRETPRHELFGSVLAIGWLFGGFLADESLYLVSMVFSTIFFLILLLQNLVTHSSIAVIHVSSFRRLVIGLLAHWTYSNGGSQGPEEMIFFDQTIPIQSISQVVVAFFFIIWMFTKYADTIDKNGFKLKSTPFLFVRGLLRGVIQISALYAIADYVIFPEMAFILFVCYLVEPFIYYIWAKLNPSISSSDMVLGDTRLPSVALRESFVANLVLLFITIAFDGVEGSEWDLLRVFYFLGVIYFIIQSWDDVKKFNENPLASSLAGQFLNNTPEMMSKLDLNHQKGLVIDKDIKLNLGNSVNFDIKPGSIIVPLEETKGKISAMIIGNSDKIVKHGKETLRETQEGITTAVIPLKEFNKIQKNFVSQSLSSLDFKQLNLPSLGEIQKLVTLFAQDAGKWVDGIKKELKKFDLTSYGVREMDGVTMVNLPGISVIEGGDVTSVKVGPIRVLESKNAQIVRIGGIITVVEFPKVSFVSLPGITVMDVPSQGSAVDLLGFRISDELPVEYIDEFKGVFQKYIQNIETQIDDEIGKILANNNASISLNMGWDGDFQPLLKDNRGLISGKVDLKEIGEPSSKALPPAQIEQNELQSKIVSITGLDQSIDKKSKNKSDKRKNKDERRKQRTITKLERAQRKIDRISEKDSSVKFKLDQISKQIDETKKSINNSETKTESSNPIDSDFVIEDAEYEILPDEDDDDKNKQG